MTGKRLYQENNEENEVVERDGETPLPRRNAPRQAATGNGSRQGAAASPPPAAAAELKKPRGRPLGSGKRGGRGGGGGDRRSGDAAGSAEHGIAGVVQAAAGGVGSGGVNVGGGAVGVGGGFMVDEGHPLYHAIAAMHANESMLALLERMGRRLARNRIAEDSILGELVALARGSHAAPVHAVPQPVPEAAAAAQPVPDAGAAAQPVPDAGAAAQPAPEAAADGGAAALDG
jgi:hypothetical protein